MFTDNEADFSDYFHVMLIFFDERIETTYVYYTPWIK